MPPANRGWRRIAGALMVLVALWCTSCTEPDLERPADGRNGGSGEDAAGMQPFAYTKPVPKEVPTAADGTYVRRVSIAEAGGAPVPCRRCAPYRFDAGRSTLKLDSGRYYVSHKSASPKVMGFSSTGHFVVEGDRIVFFNDPNCTSTRGSYTWTVSSSKLSFTVLEDPCGIGLRAEYLTALPWTTQSDAA